jgi:hypothetical protein
MARAAYRLGLVLLAALIAVPVSARDHGREKSAGVQNIGDGQTIPFSSVAPDVVVPPGEQGDSADDPNGGGPDAERGGPPDEGPPIDQSAGGNNQAIPA